MNTRSALRTTLCLVLLASFSSVVAQNDTPFAEKGMYGPLELTSKDYHLIETAEELQDQMQRRGLRYGDAELIDWLQSIGRRLAPQPTDFYQNYRFYLLRDPSPNAFALPDGQIYVHTGLIGRLKNEAQLASLLAHEINHVAGHHGILAYRSQKRKAVTGMIIGVAGATAGGWGGLASDLINVGLYASMFGYSRDLEQEADVNAYDRLLAAGYDVREMPELFAILGEDIEGLQPRMAGKWSTHPDLVLRGQYTTALAARTPADKLETLTIGSDDFRQRVRPMALASVDDYIRDDYPKTALVLARQLAAEDSEDPQAWVAVGHAHAALGVRSEYQADTPLSDKQKKQQLRLRSKLTRDELRALAAQSPDARANLDHNLAQAELAYQTALSKNPDTADAYFGLGDIYLQLDRYRDSGKAYMTYLKLRPDASDRSVAIDQLRTITEHLKSEAGE